MTDTARIIAEYEALLGRALEIVNPLIDDAAEPFVRLSIEDGTATLRWPVTPNERHFPASLLSQGDAALA